MANFSTLIAQLEQFTAYAPNENEIKIVTLKALVIELDNLRETARAAEDQLITARLHRNNTLYFSKPNVMELMRFIKAYVKSLGTVAQTYYDALVRLKFSDYKE